MMNPIIKQFLIKHEEDFCRIKRHVDDVKTHEALSNLYEDIVHNFNGDFNALCKLLTDVKIINEHEADILRIRFVIWAENLENPFPYSIEYLEREYGFLGKVEDWLEAVKADPKLYMVKCRDIMAISDGYIIGNSVTDLSEICVYIEREFGVNIRTSQLQRV